MTTERIFLSPPDVDATDRAALLDAFDSGWIAPLGPNVQAFESAFADLLGFEQTAALASGTAALHLALRLLGVDATSRVYVPTLTFVATANAVLYLGGEPVFVDCDANWVLDVGLVEQQLRMDAARGQLPAAVLAVDLYGQCADYPALAAACSQYEVPLVEDAAEALGSTLYGKPAGSFGDAAAFSFNGNKIITTSGGGLLASRDTELVRRARWLAAQAREPVVHYEHRELGYNYRLSNLLAGLGVRQFERLSSKVERRRAIFERYAEALSDFPGVEMMPEAPGCRSNRWLTCLTLDPSLQPVGAHGLCDALSSQDIEARPVWKPMHLQPMFAGVGCIRGQRAEELFEHGVCLPSGSSLTPSQQARVIEAVRGVLLR